MNCLFITEEMTLENQPNCSAFILQGKFYFLWEYTDFFFFPTNNMPTDRVYRKSKLLISVKVYVSNPYKTTLATLVRFSFRKSMKYFFPVQRLNWKINRLQLKRAIESSGYYAYCRVWPRSEGKFWKRKWSFSLASVN